VRADSVQIELQGIAAIGEIAKEIGQIGVADRLAGLIRHQVLLGDIGHVETLVILGQKMVEGLIARRAGLFWDRVVSCFGVGEHRIDIKHHATEWMLAMTQHLPDVIFGSSFQHADTSPNAALIFRYKGTVHSRGSLRGKQSVRLDGIVGCQITRICR
jgi:hypothetical protein